MIPLKCIWHSLPAFPDPKQPESAVWYESPRQFPQSRISFLPFENISSLKSIPGYAYLPKAVLRIQMSVFFSDLFAQNLFFGIYLLSFHWLKPLFIFYVNVCRKPPRYNRISFIHLFSYYMEEIQMCQFIRLFSNKEPFPPRFPLLYQRQLHFHIPCSPLPP